MIIHCNFIGGNIKVSALSGNDVYLENQIRDSSEDWFYWAFCIEGAETERSVSICSQIGSATGGRRSVMI